MKDNLFVSIFYLYILASIVVSILTASALEKRLKVRQPDTMPYRWGFYVGCMGLACGPLALVMAIATVIAGMKGRPEDCGSCFVYAVFFGFHAVSGWFIIQRRRWAWALGTVLSFNLAVWVINGMYGRNRWGEFDARADSSTNSDITTELKLEPEFFAALAAKGADTLELGIRDFEPWRAKVLSHFGEAIAEKVKGHLRQIYTASQVELAGRQARLQPEMPPPLPPALAAVVTEAIRDEGPAALLVVSKPNTEEREICKTAVAGSSIHAIHKPWKSLGQTPSGPYWKRRKGGIGFAVAGSIIVALIAVWAWQAQRLSSGQPSVEASDAKLLEARAKAGNLEAEMDLAQRYRTGDRMPKDYAQAAKWYRLAAEHGFAEAQYNLGDCYYDGLGVSRNYLEAVEWYRKAAQQGLPDAQNALGVCYYTGQGVEQAYAEALSWYGKAAQQGFAKAQYNLGLCYHAGQGVVRDNMEAVKWYQRAAQQGYEKAQYLLGDCYYEGLGVARDHAEAAKWYRKAAEQGLGEAENALGVCYYNGQGIGRDYGEAIKWYARAAEKGFPKAQYNLGVCYYSGQGVERDYAEAVRWYGKAAVQGFPKAQYSLGACYDSGQGVTRDYWEAIKWYRKAVEQGDSDAVNWFRKLAEQRGSEPRTNPAKANEPREPNEITTVDGRTYKSVRILHANRNGVEIEFKPEGGGFGTTIIRFSNLPPDLQYRYHSEAENAALEAKREADDALALTAAAENGDAQSQYALGGQCYWANRAAAVEWWRKAAEQGHPKAQSDLGSEFCRNGDFHSAATWCRRAATQGIPEAQCELGAMFFAGLGVPRDLAEAYKWFNLAAAHGDLLAAEARDRQLVPLMSQVMILEGQRRASAFVEKLEMARAPGERHSPKPKMVEKDGATGTGFFITDDGYLVTCAHVIEKWRRFHIKSASGEISAKLIKEDRSIDVALLKATGEFHAIPMLAEISRLKLGDAVFTIGFPNPDLQGVKPKLTRGEISSLAGIRDNPRYLQISVPVQPGNSGGALVDECGNVVGVVTSRLDDALTWEHSGALPQNVNYAVKSSLVCNFLKSVPELAGKIQPPHGAADREAANSAAERAAVLVIAE